ncbi:Lipopolysaccharide heptosyltransferase 1 [Andreprevotia sp. IGB-42]|uniref:lipopolysaccharide heptosyltransferase I n=1 Tax=Andreprevotia sp. IGB-42 TaxID=2497473 RepID=UPI00135812C8|nr:lipopolysaccharide heptosyltransferase I [Andreprevotia sp. IGB-42]KAF0814801.1 Lipopolysaccharide heptosyltransferase 1 [Andreprevotia sp. IGB-42]
MSRILLLRLSSMGDVIHTLPAVTDLARALPDTRIDWVAEEGFAELPRLHPAVSRVIPIALRRWRKNALDAATRREFAAFRQQLQSTRYDLVLDIQGLLKSATIGRFAHGPLAGYDRHSIREPLASLLYSKRYPVSRDQHAVLRSRQLMAAAMGYTPAGPVDYGLPAAAAALPWLPDQRHAVLLTATSRADKEWPEAHWIALGQQLAAAGLASVLPWGSPAERARAERLATAIPNAMVAPRLSLTEAAALLAGSAIVVGVDTGLAHLAAAVAAPVVAIFCASDPVRTGVLANSYAVNLGRAGAAPDVATVWQAVVAGVRS